MAARLRPVLPAPASGQALGEIAENPENAAIPMSDPGRATGDGDHPRTADRRLPPDPRDDAVPILQRIDGCRPAFYLWPGEVTAISGGADYSLPVADAALRNRLAYSVFDNEIAARRRNASVEAWGVPLALVAFDADWRTELRRPLRGCARRRAPKPRNVDRSDDR